MLADGGSATVTFTDAETLPPGFVQVRVYVVDELGETVWVLAAILLPLHPPLAVHVAAFGALQESCVEEP
jgi:hypothetical protein